MISLRKTFIFIWVSLYILMYSDGWGQTQKRTAKGPIIKQEEIAKLIGEEAGYTADYVTNLTNIGVTPLGEWVPEKDLTKDDFDAILIRMTRRNPVVEMKEPKDILNSLGFPPRGASRQEVMEVLRSEPFRRTVINSKIILCQPLLPLPPIYQATTVVLRDIKEALITVAPPAAEPVAAEQEAGGGEEPGEPPITH